MSDFREDYKDLILVDEGGRIEYFSIGNPAFFDLHPEKLIGARIPQLYENLDATSSTLMRAVNQGEETLNCVQTLITRQEKKVRQESDTLCIMDGDRVIGALEFADYDVDKDLVGAVGENEKKGDMPGPSVEDFIGETEEIRKIKRKLKKVLNLEFPILLTGESGTGKEWMARIIHRCSIRSEKEFVYVNCSALPKTLLEGILFGIRRGSFTDAEEKQGLFHLADGGILFLDEVDSMPMELQGKILRAIEEKKIRPVGGEEEVVDVRIIAACSDSAGDLIYGQQLRKDLYFRLSVVQFEIPPLRKRAGDIPLLCDYYIRRFSRENFKDISGLDDEASKFFAEYDWPGNVRELKNVIEEGVCVAEGKQIKFSDIRNRFFVRNEDNEQAEKSIADFQNSGAGLTEYLENYERECILQAMREEDGDRKAVARKLRMTQQNLKYKIEKYSL